MQAADARRRGEKATPASSMLPLPPLLLLLILVHLPLLVQLPAYRPRRGGRWGGVRTGWM